MNRVYIGTSGWVYKEWQKHFYPEDVPAKRQFEFYATQFPTVEINATFYRLPTLKMVRGWRDKAPPGFVFAVKGSRFITHILKISGASKGLRKYFSRIKPLEKRTGPVLWQLPPFMKKDLKRLERFLKILPKNYCHAVEFRHPSWYEGNDTFELLRKYRAAHVNLSSLKMPMNLKVTTDFVYIRFHGLKDGAYHDYTRAELEPWAAFSRKQARAGRNIYAYFNNDLNVHAPDNAKMLMQMIGDAAVKAHAERKTSVQAPTSKLQEILQAPSVQKAQVSGWNLKFGASLELFATISRFSRAIIQTFLSGDLLYNRHDVSHSGFTCQRNRSVD